jgi:hypothetical protein
MSYTSKMMESIFSNRLLTGKERARLAGAQAMFWGASGTFIGGPVVDYFTTEGGMELSPQEFTALRYGALDWMIGATLGSQTGFGERLAVGEGMWNLWEDYNNQTMFETLGGPSAQTGKDIFDGIYELLGDVATGNTSMVRSDIKKLLRNATGPNKLFNAYVIYTTGDYLSRNGDVVASGLTNTDAFLSLIGAPLQEVTQTYTRREAFRDQDKHIRDVGNRVAEISRDMSRKIKAGDLEGAQENAKLMAMWVAILPNWAKSKARKRYAPDATSALYDSLVEGRRRQFPNLNNHEDKGE